MSSNLDKYEFDKNVAVSNILLAVLLTTSGLSLAAGIAFLTTGATEINHVADAPKDSQNKMVATGIKFIESGANLFFIGLLIATVSGIVFPVYVLRIYSQLRANKSENIQNSDQPDSVKTDQREEEIKNTNIRLEMANLKLEIVNLKLELTTQKLEQATNKKKINNRKKNTKDL